jgi:hypothetical protein
MVLTEKGKTTRERTDFERIRVRGFLREEMLHPLLQGRIYSYFAGDDPGTAVFEAFKTVEIEVRLPDRACRTPGWAPRFAAVAGAWPGGKPQGNDRTLGGVLDHCRQYWIDVAGDFRAESQITNLARSPTRSTVEVSMTSNMEYLRAAWRLEVSYRAYQAELKRFLSRYQNIPCGPFGQRNLRPACDYGFGSIVVEIEQMSCRPKAHSTDRSREAMLPMMDDESRMSAGIAMFGPDEGHHRCRRYHAGIVDV